MTMHHLEAERAILAATFLSRAVVDRLILDHALQPADFDQPHHQRTWAAILQIHARGAKIDPITLGDTLGATVPPGFVQELPGWADAISSIGEHAQIVKRHALRRSWHAAAQRLIEASDTDNEQLVAQAEALLAAPTGTDETWTPERLGEDVCDFLTEKGQVGISTGIPKLDDLLAGGLRPGDMTAIGAWTSMGKSVLVDTFLHDAALGGKSCHVYVNEMSPRDRTLRTLARMGAAPYAQLARREIGQRDAPGVLDAARRIPFGVTDCSQWDAAQIGRHARANRWDLWAVDLVHNMAYERESELHQIVATLAAAARSSNSHLLLVAQFNEARAIGETLPVPVARDIRGSGMIKNLSANVLLLHREQTNQGGFVTTSRDGILKVEKSRHGQLGMVPVTFHPDEMRFKGGRSLEAVAPLRVVRKDTA